MTQASVFNRIALMGRQRKDGIEKTLVALYNFLRGKGYPVVFDHETALGIGETKGGVPEEHLHEACDLLVVVGGDGSLFAIVAKVEALNEIVLSPGNVAHMIEFEVLINDQFVYDQQADGLIIATPTGSTAYALSGGGPILHPSLNAVVLVPMFPHTLSNRPIVMDANSRISIKIAENNEATPFLSGDGLKRIALLLGNTIHISKKTEQLRLIHPVEYSYFENLRSKLRWQSKNIV